MTHGRIILAVNIIKLHEAIDAIGSEVSEDASVVVVDESTLKRYNIDDVLITDDKNVILLVNPRN